MKKIVSIMLILVMILCIGPVSFANYSEDSQIASVGAISTLIDKRYPELRNDTHKHKFDTNQCICGIYKADYSGYDAAYDRYQQLMDNNDFNDAAIEYITEKHQEMIDEHLDGRWLRNNYSEEEQHILDALENDFNKMCDDLEAGIADGTFINPDYTEIEAKISELEEKDVGNEYKDEIDGFKAELEEIKATNPESMAEIEDELADIEQQVNKIIEKIDAIKNCTHSCHKGGISGCFWKIKLFFSKIFGTNKTCDCGIAHY